MMTQIPKLTYCAVNLNPARPKNNISRRDTYEILNSRIIIYFGHLPRRDMYNMRRPMVYGKMKGTRSEVSNLGPANQHRLHYCKIL